MVREKLPKFLKSDCTQVPGHASLKYCKIMNSKHLQLQDHQEKRTNKPSIENAATKNTLTKSQNTQSIKPIPKKNTEAKISPKRTDGKTMDLIPVIYNEQLPQAAQDT